ncbi:TonB-dependent siderophore receptor [Methylobacterium oxalidis]|uniref:Ligand-gated channel n=1 Tax=Methylobacterium oxalidis TaxID=944322 RepID=A0A512JBJ5_9HYPH|nr:TonB-dependent siderophore receptor [Methylobacterium oxalidis]GEP07255.1 ligand-gated channel [Methylobacterium oxalidis]GJE32594.1 Ferrichrome outer membrane transporter/phage receptor [Methylobacterium oxalidis]GLS63803.1 ligand-gated channel [Methylobacterium oxalidis]
MSDRSFRLALLLATTCLAGAANAQDTAVQLDQLSVEGVASAPAAASNLSAGDGGTAATSGGGGGPSGITGYVARVATAATKTNTPLIEVPQSVSVLTREQLNDRNVQTFTDAVNYVPGAISARSGFDPRFDQIFIRGFDVLTNQGIYRDGLRVIGSGFAYPKSEPYGAEALTILRGPASGLYGLGSPGGILDITTKRPVFVPFGEVQFQAGSFDRFQGNFDVGGPVPGSDGTMAYRLTGLRREAGTFIGLGTTDDQLYLAPAFTWKPSADTTVTFLSEFQITNTPAATFFYNDPGFRVSNFYQGDPRFIGLDQTQYRVGYAFEHKFTPDLIFRQNFRHYGLFLVGKYVDINNINVARTIGTRDTGYIREGLVQQTLDNQLEARFATGPIAHTVVGGVDYARYSLSQRLGFGLAPDLNLVTRNYGQQFIATPALGPASRQSQDQIGVYLQDQAKFGDFILTLNGRHDWVFQNNYATPDSAVSRQDNSAFTGRVGLGYVLAPGLVPYASYATTFTPQVGLDRNGQAFRPATGDQIEAGVKYLIPGTNIQAAFAGFEINQSNILIPDATNIAFQTAGGAVRSKGFEAEATANLAPGTNLTIAYTHVDIRFVNSTSFTGESLNGNRVSGIPSDTYASFLTYAFPLSSPLFGLQIGGGIRFIGPSFADDQNTVRNTAVTLYDALIAYDFAAIDPKYKGLRAQVNAYNIFDRNYTTCSFGFCNFNQPATVIGSLIYRW